MAKILIIEDDPYVQRMYKRMFSFEKFEIIMASKGEEGIALAKKENPDLILLDIILPGMDGFQVLSRLKKDSATKNIKVLMLTNLGEDVDIERAEKLGAACYMVKADFSPNEVIQEVKRHLKQ